MYLSPVTNVRLEESTQDGKKVYFDRETGTTYTADQVKSFKKARAARPASKSKAKTSDKPKASTNPDKKPAVKEPEAPKTEHKSEEGGK